MGICGIVNRLNLDLKRLRFYRVGKYLSFIWCLKEEFFGGSCLSGTWLDHTIGIRIEGL